MDDDGRYNFEVALKDDNERLRKRVNFLEYYMAKAAILLKVGTSHGEV